MMKNSPGDGRVKEQRCQKAMKTSPGDGRVKGRKVTKNSPGDAKGTKMQKGDKEFTR